MDPTAFDRLTRIVSASASRRGALAALLGALGAPLVPGTDAARRRKTKGKNGRGKAKAKARSKAKRTGKAKTKTRAAQPRQSPAQQAQAEAARCCASGNCAPGKGKNLAKCCYQKQDLTGKTFSGANLGSANFSGATLTGANLHGANLGKACLVDADLRGVKMNNLTNLAGAIYCRTKTDSGENNAGCTKGTPCCPTCDEAHPCGQGQVCCKGRCLPGECCNQGERSSCGAGQICCDRRCVADDCCETADCPAAVCQRRACEDHQCVYTPVSGEPGPGCDTICCRDLLGQPDCCEGGTTQCEANGVCGCPGCECIGTPNRFCSVFDGPPCCPGFVCTPISIFLPFVTECQLPCERNADCAGLFGPLYTCQPGDREGSDCAFLDRCCQVFRSSGASASKVGWPRNGEQFDALAKLVWTRTSRGATVGTIAGAALLGRPIAMAAGRKGGNGFAPGAVTFRLPWRRRG